MLYLRRFLEEWLRGIKSNCFDFIRERSEGGQPEAALSEGQNTKYILEEWLRG